MFVAQLLEQDLVGEDADVQICQAGQGDDPSFTTTAATTFATTTTMKPNTGGGIQGKDHTNFLLVVAGFLTALVIFFIIFFRTKYKRTLADVVDNRSDDIEKTKM